ncbi:hypothetical protein M8818_004972 [Zalaria obscura]|uniref:Uncharacterized protein n=1 Tax=Zalaria obscura TaxID=2024903 RepID=A0ACC3SAJ9_9PEZI
MADTASVTMQGSANTRLSRAALAATTNLGSLHNKVALITGASSGLGRAIAQAYAAAGAFVVSADLSPSPPKAPLLAETLKASDLTTPTVDILNRDHPSPSEKRRAIFVECDVTIPESMQAAVATTVSEYGRLDIMVNNAGISPEISTEAYAQGRDQRIHETDPLVLDKGWAVNGKGVWLGCKYATAQMLLQDPHPSGDRGWIINMCSVLGLVGLPGASTYCATKGAVVQITKSVALEYAKDKIHVNCINPGFTETNLLEPMRAMLGVENFKAWLESVHPWGRLGLPEDVAKMAVFLAGEGASWVTGQSFVVDGGFTAQ